MWNSQELDDLMKILICSRNDLMRLAGKNVTPFDKVEFDLPFSLARSTKVIKVCVILVKCAYMKHIEQLVQLQNYLRENQKLMDKIINYRGPFNSVQDYVHSYQETYMSLPVIWKSSNILLEYIVESIELISEARTIHWKSIDIIFRIYLRLSSSFPESLETFCNAVLSQIHTYHKRYSDLKNIRRYLKRETLCLYTSSNENDEQTFIIEVFGGKKPRNVLLQTVLRESLIMTAKCHDFDVEHIDFYERHIVEHIQELLRLKVILNELMTSIELKSIDTNTIKNLMRICELNTKVHCVQNIVKCQKVHST